MAEREARAPEDPEKEDSMNTAVIYARVSGREQEREGYSIPAQLKLLKEYARQRSLHVVQEFVDVESAKNPGRREFGNMLRFLETDEQCRVVLVRRQIVCTVTARMRFEWNN